MMQSTSFRILMLFFVIFSSSVCFGQATNQEMDSSVKFEVSSVRVMTDEERARKAGDNLDGDLVMKCRISNQGNVTVYLYTDFVNSMVPNGYMVKRTDKGLVWVLDAAGRESSKSPGFSPLKSGSWLLLGSGDAIEWEPVQASGQIEETRAMTVFMKYGGKENVVEVFSNFYKAPARNSSPTK